MKKKNIVNRKLKFLAWQLDKCAKIGIALCEENNLITIKLGACRTALSKTREEFEKVCKTRDLDRHAYDEIVGEMGNFLNMVIESRNKYRMLFWSLVTLYSAHVVAHVAITHFCTK